jgi:hypothetical protein
LTDDSSISGSTAVTLMDQMRALFWGVSRFSRIAGVVSIIISISIIGLLLVPKVVYTTVVYSTGIVRWTIEAWAVSIVFCLIWPLVTAVAHRRLSNAQKQLSYEINLERILVRDGTGSMVSIPWSVVRRVTETKSGFSIRVRPLGARWLCKQAFTTDAIESLRRLARAKLGRNAHLKK